MAEREERRVGGTKARLIQISGASTAKPRGHVVFVHGLCGSSHSWWSARGSELHESWPGWLSTDIADLGVWVADYPASPLWWVRAPGIRLEHRAATILQLVAARDLGSAPLVFICHSLGGLVVKKAMQLATTSTNPAAGAIAAATRGVVFLGTPHLGSDWAELTKSQMGRLVGSDAVVDLRTDNEELAKLHAWYSEFSGSRGIRHLVAYEVKPIKLLWQQLPLICPTDTSAPNLPAATYLPVEADHVNLSKPARFDPCTTAVSAFVDDCIMRPAAPSGEHQYLEIINQWATSAGLDDWDQRASQTLRACQPMMTPSLRDTWRELLAYLAAIEWPGGCPALEEAMSNFAAVLTDLLAEFDQHATAVTRGEAEMLLIPRWYDTEPFALETLRAWEESTRLINDLTLELTRAANLVCDVVRRGLDWSFRAGEPPLSVSELDWRYAARYREGECYPGLARFRVERLGRA